MRIRNFIGRVVAIVVCLLSGFTSINAEAAVYIPNNDDEFIPYSFETSPEEADYNVLFIGNSITFHPVCDYWWGFWGMAASTRENDYVHQVVSGLEKTYGEVNFDIISFSLWERDDTRSNVLPNIDSILNNGYDLVVIQLGENTHDISNFENEYEELVETVKNSNPDASIVLVGDFWKKSGRDGMKKNVALRQHCSYVDISDFRNKASYRSYIGDEVYGYDGQLHYVDFNPVTAHPNDKAMAKIASRILDSLQ